MTNLLTRRPERPLPSGRHEKLRADLLDAIEANETRTSRRIAGPVAAAAAVLAVAAGVAIAVPALKDDDGAVPATGRTTGPAETRELSAADTQALRTQCLAEANRITANGIERPFVDYTTIRAFEFVGVKDPKVVTTWLMSEGEVRFREGPKGIKVDPIPGYWFCSRTAGGVISESSIRSSKEGMILIGSPVHRLARNAGVYTSEVARITVQPKGKAPIEALLQDGFWFAPTQGRTNWGPYDADDPERADYVIRSYDAAGRQLSSTEGPTRSVTCPAPIPSSPKEKVSRPTQRPVNPDCREYYWPS